ncbi:MAG: VRR-NUC domain-containing protein [Gammaproteobacteria bacterium]|nr:VRR-NUC domain-containing protein [Gammaproteobacteria bacterium]
MLCEEVEMLGGWAYKFTSPGRRNVPDRLCVLPGLVFFVEVKGPGKEPTPAQERELQRLAKLNQWVFAINNITGLRRMLKRMKEVMESD